MKIESEKVILHIPQERIFRFLGDFNNFGRLMPEDRISGWQSTGTECSFQIKGLAKIGMKINGTTPNSEINIVSHGKNPFDFTLDILIGEDTESGCSVHMAFSGDANPFLSAMIERPLTNFFNMLTGKLGEISSEI